jgi:hypothetical protein
MNFVEKAGMRIEHWIKHSQSHFTEYEAFADELEQAGYKASAEEIRQMAALTRKGIDHLGSARSRLD